MSTVIPPDLEVFIHQEVASGKYRSREEVIFEGLRLLRERDRKLSQLRADLQVGLDQLHRGEGEVIDDDEAHRDFIADIETRGQQRLAAQKGSQ